MIITGDITLDAQQDFVWEKLNDPEILRVCMPGCEELEKVSDNGFRAVVKLKVGPVSARFKGRVTLSDLDPPQSYRITGEGEGGIAGFAKGSALVQLKPNGSGTQLIYEVNAQLGGKLAQLGQRLIGGTARKFADEFFSNFSAALTRTGPGGLLAN